MAYHNLEVLYLGDGIECCATCKMLVFFYFTEPRRLLLACQHNDDNAPLWEIYPGISFRDIEMNPATIKCQYWEGK